LDGKEIFNMAKCYQLIGVPGSGKSTWVAHQEWADKCAYISTDKWVDDYARDMGKTYNEVFKEYMPTAVKQMAVNVNFACALQLDIVWDQTSTTVNSRKKKFNMLLDYEHIAVVFRTPESEELAKRLASRPGKNIPDYVVRTMIDGFEMPTLAEGFIEIIHV
jgi:predicted kinase